MVKHWNRHLREETNPKERRRMKRSRVINTVGFLMTGSVLIIVLATKFTHGAYLVVIAMPILYLIMRSVRKHYDRVAAELETPADEKGHVAQPGPRDRPGLEDSQTDAAGACPCAGKSAVDAGRRHGFRRSGDTKEMAADWERRGISVPLKILILPTGRSLSADC